MIKSYKKETGHVNSEIVTQDGCTVLYGVGIERSRVKTYRDYSWSFYLGWTRCLGEVKSTQRYPFILEWIVRLLSVPQRRF